MPPREHRYEIVAWRKGPIDEIAEAVRGSAATGQPVRVALGAESAVTWRNRIRSRLGKGLWLVQKKDGDTHILFWAVRH